MRRILATVGVLILLSGCTTHYRNFEHPSYGQTEGDRDLYECRRENTRPSAVKAGSYASAEMVVDESMVKQCMAARGWRPANE